jgi:Tfp pilus assembly protein PilF
LFVGRRQAIVFAAIAIAITTGACSSGLPKPDSKKYRDLVAAFYVGLSGLQSGEDVRAQQRLTQATELAPGEPAGWANLGLLAVRHQDLEKAYEHVEKARSLAPNNSQIEALLGLIESRRGKLPEAIAHLKRAAELDPANLRALYSLSQETERQGSEAADAEAQQWLQKILAAQPENLAVLLEVARLAAKRGDGETLKTTTSRLAAKIGIMACRRKRTDDRTGTGGSRPEPAIRRPADRVSGVTCWRPLQNFARAGMPSALPWSLRVNHS